MNYLFRCSQSHGLLANQNLGVLPRILERQAHGLPLILSPVNYPELQEPLKHINMYSYHFCPVNLGIYFFFYVTPEKIQMIVNYKLKGG